MVLGYMYYDLIELCAGTAAVTFAALGEPRFPCSRIGSKLGYAAQIVKIMAIPKIERAMIVDTDKRLMVLHAALLRPVVREQMARDLCRQARTEARACWKRACKRDDPTSILLELAGRRGGVGGFKGLHILRASVDGFIPSRRSLATRVMSRKVTDAVVCTLTSDVSELHPWRYAPTTIYMDAPYAGCTGYPADKAFDPVALA